MVFRFLIRIFTQKFINDEKLVSKLSDSYPIRSLARTLVSLFAKSKELIQETELSALNKQNLEKMKQKSKKMFQDAKQDLEQMRKDIFKKPKL